MGVHFKNVAAVCKLVQESPGHALSLEDSAPVAERQVTGDEHARALVAFPKDPEQELAAAATEGQIAQLIAYQ